ncbi:hypothetical protein [Streptomyces sp. AM6-12]|uniref:hypothetical protein n=1 Tax=Streptomyces sp. AM6-12 TaxID=3345149 RepID=UPI00378816E4
MPVGSWSWETKTRRPGAGLAAECVRQVLDVWAILRSLGLCERDARAGITVEAEEGLVLLSRTGVPVDASVAAAEDELLRILQSVDYPRVGAMTIELACSGSCLREGEAHHVRKLFVVSVDAWPSGATTVTLRTFSDAWMSHDLRGHKQPAVQAENAPRLKRALIAITRLTEAAVVPSDPTPYGIPTEDGFEDLPDEDPDLLDSWYMFEVPRRTEWLRRNISPDTPQFEGQSELPVVFADVAMSGNVLGYIWAADGDDAAGYEPRAAAGDAALDAAQEWLTRLSQAKQRGLSPTEALHELASWPGNAASGTVVSDSLREARSLETLQDLSGRE